MFSRVDLARRLLGLALAFVALAQGLVFAGQSDRCERLLAPQRAAREAVAKLGAALPGVTRLEPDRQRVVRELDDGTVIGALDYLELPGHVLSIEKIEVDPRFRRQGLNRLLAAQALLALPPVERIVAKLAWSNAEAFYDAQRALPLFEKLFHPLRGNLRAVESTPFYKIYARLGFSRIVRALPRDELIDLELALDDGLSR